MATTKGKARGKNVATAAAAAVSVAARVSRLFAAQAALTGQTPLDAAKRRLALARRGKGGARATKKGSKK